MTKGGNKKRFPCGHRGYGGFCHRCDYADQLEKMAEAKQVLVTHKALKKPRKWTFKEMLDEAARLKKTGQR